MMSEAPQLWSLPRSSLLIFHLRDKWLFVSLRSARWFADNSEKRFPLIFHHQSISFSSSSYERFIPFAFSIVISHGNFIFPFFFPPKSILSAFSPPSNRRMFYRLACTHGMLFVLSSQLQDFPRTGLKNNFRARRIYLCLKDLRSFGIYFSRAKQKTKQQEKKENRNGNRFVNKLKRDQKGLLFAQGSR